MKPDFKVQIYGFNEKLVTVPLVTLAAWKAALNMERKPHFTGKRPVAGIVRIRLGCPPSMNVEDLYKHVAASYDDIMEQLEGKTEPNFQPPA